MACQAERYAFWKKTVEEVSDTHDLGINEWLQGSLADVLSGLECNTKAFMDVLYGVLLAGLQDSRRIIHLANKTYPLLYDAVDRFRHEIDTAMREATMIHDAEPVETKDE